MISYGKTFLFLLFTTQEMPVVLNEQRTMRDIAIIDLAGVNMIEPTKVHNLIALQRDLVYLIFLVCIQTKYFKHGINNSSFFLEKLGRMYFSQSFEIYHEVCTKV